MSGAIGTIVDPFIFSTCGTLEDRVASYELVHQLRPLFTGNATTSSGAISALQELGKLMSQDSISCDIKESGIETFSAVDIGRAFHVLSELEPYAEEQLKITTALESSQSQPSEFLLRLPLKVAEEFASVLTAIKLYSDVHCCALPEVLTLQIPSDVVQITARLILEQHGCDPCLDHASPKVIEWEHDLFEMDSVVSDDQDFISLVDQTARERSGTTLKTLRVSDKFESSIVRHNIRRLQSVWRRLIRVAATVATGDFGNTGIDNHQVREGAGPTEDAVYDTSRGALWRCKITQKGAGYRLHYWHASDGSIEFDEILTESEVS